MTILRGIYNRYLKTEFLNVKFRKHNKHNKISFSYVNKIDNVIAGKYSYGIINLYDFKNGSKLIIGNCCSIARNVTFCLGGEHNYKAISTFPFENVNDDKITSSSKGDIVIGDDVWIGMNSTILSGVKIGKGAVIAAGSIVTEDVDEFCIYGGVPAKFIKKRFDDSVIKKIKSIDYSKINDSNISEVAKLLNCTIDVNRLDDMLKDLDKILN